jgi:hypothetical protein
MTTSTAKRIQFNRADKDYSAYYDDNCIGTFSTYHQAEIELDAHALDLLERGLIDTAEGITTMQWQAPRDVVYARPAEVVEVVEVQAEPTDEELLAEAWHIGTQIALCGGLNHAPAHYNERQSEIQLILHQRDMTRLPALPAASPAAAIEARTPCTTDTPEVPTGGREEAAPPMLMPEGDWLDTDGMRVADPRATLIALLRASLEEWQALGLPTPYDVALAQLARLLKPPSGHFLACQVCGGPHRATQCPGVTAEKARQQRQLALGRALWGSYCERRETLRAILKDSEPARRQEMASAAAAFLSECWGRAVPAGAVLNNFEWLIKNAAPA